MYHDVLIIGAGLSGISAAHHLKDHCPDKTYAILEGREAMGGTWDLFRYPGIRSDSDMYTLGYSFKPWTDPQAIADGPAILKYINDTAQEGGIADKITYQTKVTKASWSTTDQKWTVFAEHAPSGTQTTHTCNFLMACCGYYDYDEGYTPDYPGIENYKGPLVHPQKWTEDIDYDNKNVVVIGSGATAVTLIPELAKSAASVTMLQRSPTYVVSAPREDAVANFLKKVLPLKLAYSLSRWKNITMSILVYNACMKWPKGMAKFLLKGVKKEMGEQYADVAKHFTPFYNPWEQRLCLVPESDLFEVIKSGKAKIVTDHIDTFDSDGIKLKSGEKLKADLVVSATGLKMKLMGGIELTVDGNELVSSDLLCYRGMMFNGIPNMAMAFGYTNASWTLKCDLVNKYVCRLLQHMDKNKFTSCTPTVGDEQIERLPFVDFTSGYFQRSIDELPKQGNKGPWKINQNYVKDIISLKHSSLKEDSLHFV